MSALPGGFLRGVWDFHDAAVYLQGLVFLDAAGIGAVGSNDETALLQSSREVARCCLTEKNQS